MIHATPSISTQLQADLDELDALHASLAHEIGRAAPWDGTLRRDARVESVVASTSIEGYAVAPDDARALVVGAHLTTGDDESRWAVACYARAMDHVRILSDDPVFVWDHRVILDLHFDACLFQRTRSPGRYRDTPIHVTAPRDGWTYTAPDAEQVIELMARTSTWLATEALDLHVAVRAAMAHLHVVSIHPFRDGNGRISRIVQSLVLARSGILAPEFASIEPFLAAETDEYYRQLQAAQGPAYDPSRDATAWVEFCIAAHIAQGHTFERRVKTLAARWNALEAIVAARSWPERLVIALEHALTIGLSRAAYVAEAGTTAPTATLDIRRLVDTGLVEQRGAGRTTTYVASASLLELIENVTP